MKEGLLHIHHLCITRNLPFVTFRLPQQEQSTTYIQTGPGKAQWGSILDISGETGFIMAPFDTRNGHTYMLIRPDLEFRTDEIDNELIHEVEKLEERAARIGPMKVR